MSIPFTVLGGFLGAGKTTLLNRILGGQGQGQGQGQRRFAVLVNDFGDLAIDGDLVTAHDGDTITFANGCVCCSIGDDFVGTLMRLLQREPPPEHVLVEASGVSDPQAIAEFALLHPKLRRDLVVVLVDVATIRARAADPCLADTVAKQLAAADLLVLNKCDQIDEAEQETVRYWLAQQRSRAPVVACEQAQVPVALLFGGRVETLATTAKHEIGGPAGHPFSSLTLSIETPLHLETLRRALETLPPSVLRAKGFVYSDADPQRRYLIQLSGRHVDLNERGLSRHSSADSRLVLIGTADMPDAVWLRARLVP